MLAGQPKVDWELSSYESFLDWGTNFIHLIHLSYLSDICVLFIILTMEMEHLGQPVQNPEDDAAERRIVQALQDQWVKFALPVSPFIIVFLIEY